MLKKVLNSNILKKVLKKGLKKYLSHICSKSTQKSAQKVLNPILLKKVFFEYFFEQKSAQKSAQKSTQLKFAQKKYFFEQTRPGPAFGRPGLEGIVGTCTLRDGYTETETDAPLRACGAQLGREGSLLFGAMG